MQVEEGRRWGAGVLREAGIHAPQRDVDLLLEEVLRCPPALLLAHPERELSSAEKERFCALVFRRCAREPLAYLLGRKGFWGRDFSVGPGCLVPRADTECLLETVLGVFSGGFFVDWGTGSGCIAATLALERPASRGMAVDASPRALAWAWKNFRDFGVLERIELVHTGAPADIPLEPDSVDLVVSNPPYIPSSRQASLMPEVREFEPPVALDGGPDGLDPYRTLLPWASVVLKAGGYLAVEVGDVAQTDWLREHTTPPLVWKNLFLDLAGDVRGAVWQKAPPVAYNG